MKKKEKQGLIILIMVAILIIAIIWFATRPKNEEPNTPNGTSQSQVAQGEYTKVEADGTVVNTKGITFEESQLKVSFWVKELNNKDKYKLIITNEIRKFTKMGEKNE